MADRIGIQPDAVLSLAGRIDLVHCELNSSETGFERHAWGISHHAVTEALNDFNGAWSDKRAEIRDDLVAIAEWLRRAATAMVDADLELSAALQETGEPR